MARTYKQFPRLARNIDSGACKIGRAEMELALVQLKGKEDMKRLKRIRDRLRVIMEITFGTTDMIATLDKSIRSQKRGGR